MPPTRMFIMAAAAAAIFALPAFATADQATPADPGMTQAPDPSTTSMSVPAAAAPDASVNTSATVLGNSQVTSGQAQALKSGDNTLVTNGPVPDTAANRAKFGRPMSNAGKRTPPAGN